MTGGRRIRLSNNTSLSWRHTQRESSTAGHARHHPASVHRSTGSALTMELQPFHSISLLFLANTAGSPPPSRPATKAEASRLATKAEAKCLPGWAGDPHVDHFRRFDSLEIVAQSSVGKCRQQRLRPAELFLHGCFPSDCMRNSGGRFCDRDGAEEYRPRRYSPAAPVISPARTSSPRMRL